MIRLSKHKKTIDFIPNKLFPLHQIKKANLIYAVKCPKCDNIIQAAFNIDNEIPTHVYEETRVLHTQEGKDQGSLFYISPRSEDPKRHTNYESKILTVNNKKTQIIRLKNHVIPLENMDKTFSDKFEAGERICMYVAIISTDKIMALKHTYNIVSNCSSSWVDKVDFTRNYATLLTDPWTKAIDPIKMESYGVLPVYIHTATKTNAQYSVSFANLNSHEMRYK